METLGVALVLATIFGGLAAALYVVGGLVSGMVRALNRP